ncbi:MAG TPA: YlcI/YnfO family protein [Chloroflexota bacterium]|jgi:hypothetical protein|nr:YlcI/YnfO family protein [Chloroflexota bacterium]
MTKIRDAVTVRIPSDLLQQTRTVKCQGESLNDVIVTALQREVRRRTAVEVGERIVRARERMVAQGARSADSTELIRSLREDRQRDD